MRGEKAAEPPAEPFGRSHTAPKEAFSPGDPTVTSGTPSALPSPEATAALSAGIGTAVAAATALASFAGPAAAILGTALGVALGIAMLASAAGRRPTTRTKVYRKEGSSSP